MVNRLPVHYARSQSCFIATRHNRLELLNRIRNAAFDEMESAQKAIEGRLSDMNDHAPAWRPSTMTSAS